MTTLETITAYFKADPLKVLYLLGGAGGVWFWIKEWRARVRIRAESKSDSALEGVLTMSVEFINLGTEPTSVSANAYVTAMTHDGKKTIQIPLTAVGDRQIQPHAPKTIEFTGQCSEQEYLFSWYRVCRFTFSRGFNTKVCSLNAERQKITYVRAIVGRLLLKAFRYVP